MERTPFDGCVFHFKGDTLWQAWGVKAFGEADVRQGVEDLKATPFKRFTHNFLRLNTAPAKLDWFDNHSAILNNVKLMARAARDGGCKGILFDTEQYEGQLFDYAKQRDAKTKSWDEYAAQVRKPRPRGDGGVSGRVSGFDDLPDIRLRGCRSRRPVTTWRSAPRHITDCSRRSSMECWMQQRGTPGLWTVTNSRMATKMWRASPRLTKRCPPRCSRSSARISNAIVRFFSFGFGIWIDYDWRKKGWDDQDVSKNYYTPEGFEKTVSTALKTADEYVWIYTETPRWWSAEGKTVKLPVP